jgi:hypothetical protein
MENAIRLIITASLISSGHIETSGNVGFGKLVRISNFIIKAKHTFLLSFFSNQISNPLGIVPTMSILNF